MSPVRFPLPTTPLPLRVLFLVCIFIVTIQATHGAKHGGGLFGWGSSNSKSSTSAKDGTSEAASKKTSKATLSTSILSSLFGSLSTSSAEAGKVPAEGAGYSERKGKQELKKGEEKKEVKREEKKEVKKEDRKTDDLNKTHRPNWRKQTTANPARPREFSPTDGDDGKDSHGEDHAEEDVADGNKDDDMDMWVEVNMNKDDLVHRRLVSIAMTPRDMSPVKAIRVPQGRHNRPGIDHREDFLGENDKAHKALGDDDDDDEPYMPQAKSAPATEAVPKSSSLDQYLVETSASFTLPRNRLLHSHHSAADNVVRQSPFSRRRNLDQFTRNRSPQAIASTSLDSPKPSIHPPNHASPNSHGKSVDLTGSSPQEKMLRSSSANSSSSSDLFAFLGGGTIDSSTSKSRGARLSSSIVRPVALLQRMLSSTDAKAVPSAEDLTADQDCDDGVATKTLTPELGISEDSADLGPDHFFFSRVRLPLRKKEQEDLGTRFSFELERKLRLLPERAVNDVLSATQHSAYVPKESLSARVYIVDDYVDHAYCRPAFYDRQTALTEHALLPFHASSHRNLISRYDNKLQVGSGLVYSRLDAPLKELLRVNLIDAVSPLICTDKFHFVSVIVCAGGVLTFKALAPKGLDGHHWILVTDLHQLFDDIETVPMIGRSSKAESIPNYQMPHNSILLTLALAELPLVSIPLFIDLMSPMGLNASIARKRISTIVHRLLFPYYQVPGPTNSNSSQSATSSSPPPSSSSSSPPKSSASVSTSGFRKIDVIELHVETRMDIDHASHFHHNVTVTGDPKRTSTGTADTGALHRLYWHEGNYPEGLGEWREEANFLLLIPNGTPLFEVNDIGRGDLFQHVWRAFHDNLSQCRALDADSIRGRPEVRDFGSDLQRLRPLLVRAWQLAVEKLSGPWCQVAKCLAQVYVYQLFQLVYAPYNAYLVHIRPMEPGQQHFTDAAVLMRKSLSELANEHLPPQSGQWESGNSSHGLAESRSPLLQGLGRYRVKPDGPFVTMYTTYCYLAQKLDLNLASRLALSNVNPGTSSDSPPRPSLDDPTKPEQVACTSSATSTATTTTAATTINYTTNQSTKTEDEHSSLTESYISHSELVSVLAERMATTTTPTTTSSEGGEPPTANVTHPADPVVRNASSNHQDDLATNDNAEEAAGAASDSDG